MPTAITNNPLFNATRNIRSILDLDQKKRSVLMILLMIGNAVMDILGITVILGLIMTALGSETITSADYSRTADMNDVQHYFNLLLRELYSSMGAQSDVQLLFYLSFIILCLFLIKNAVSLWISYVQARFTFNISLRLSKKTFKKLYDRGYMHLSEISSGDMVYQVVDIPNRFAINYLMPLFGCLTEIIMVSLLCVGLFLYNPVAVPLLILTIGPVIMGIYTFSRNRVKNFGVQRNTIAPANYAKVMEAMKGYADTKLANKENYVLDSYSASQDSLNALDAKYQGIYAKINQKTTDIIFGLGIFIVFGYAYFTSMASASVLELLGFFGIAAYKVLPATNRILGATLQIKNNAFVVPELQKVADYQFQPFSEVAPLPFRTEIKLDGISFAYNGDDGSVLDRLSIRLPKGSALGIIGSSGSGKSTFLKIFLRLIQENQGGFYVDNILLDSHEKNASFQRIIGYVEQDVFVKNGTLENNVAFLEEKIDYGKLERALEDAMLLDFVRDQKEGFQMKLGEGGVKLSGGQKQRLGIARALYRDSEILVFDEITSALDPTTEKAIVESINRLSSLGKTVIIVAHRITTLERCDRIIELKDGKIYREPTYKELLSEIV